LNIVGRASILAAKFAFRNVFLTLDDDLLMYFFPPAILCLLTLQIHFNIQAQLAYMLAFRS
jgi:hypothetical protein